MAKTDFTFVGQPHDPLSISGSDPHTGSMMIGKGARLAAWYKVEPGYYLTSSSKHKTDHGPGYNYIYKLYDASGRPESRDRNLVGSHLAMVGDSVGHNSSTYQAVISSSMVNKGYIGGDNQYFLIGRPDASNARLRMANRPLRGWTNIDVDNSDQYEWQSTWISGAYSAGSAIADSGKWEGQTQIAAIKHHHGASTTNYGFGLTYGSLRNDTTFGNSYHNTFSMGLNKHANAPNKLELEYYWNDVGDNASSKLESTRQDLQIQNWHIITGRGNKDPGDPASTACVVDLFGNGERQAHRKIPSGDGEMPVFVGQTKMVQIGGRDSILSGYMQSNSQNYIKENDASNAEFSGVAEWMIFEDALSDVRRQQMEQYLADKCGIEMSSSTYLSQMNGGAEGTAQVHSTLSNALGSNGTYCRAYSQAATSSAVPLIQHETTAGAFLTSQASSGQFYKVSSESAISLYMHVRAESLNDSNHTGSQVALVAKATSPFGHQMDNIKGYALKFGTLKDEYDSGDSPTFRLSLRNSDQWLDGKTSESCGDIDVSNDSLTPAVDNWYSMRIDVIPSGHSFDRIKAWAKAASSGTWLALSDASDNTYWDVKRDDANYRFWCNDNKFNKNRVPIQNGVHNGYLVNMSSSTGHTLTTKYYIDGFTAKLDTV